MRQFVDPNISDIHRNLIRSVEFLILLGDWNWRISAAVDVVASFGIVILSLVLLDSFGPSQRMEDFRSFVFLKRLRWQVSQLPDRRQGSLPSLGIIGNSINEQNTESYHSLKVYLVVHRPFPQLQ